MPENASSTSKLPDFAETEHNAHERARRWRARDPFPDIEPALLNSADLLDYVAAAAVLYPWSVTANNLDKLVKPASCAVGCTGQWIRWSLDTKSGELHDDPDTGEVTSSDPLKLPANTITFLHLGTQFRIPTYIAARFNLAIREIHRGILVGTGPLVDPGFSGRLLIPLHNLTSNDYRIAYDEPLVWVEFTKLSTIAEVKRDFPQRRKASFIDFPERKNERDTAMKYLLHAHQGLPIASSIPQEVARAVRKADDAVATVSTLRRAFAIGLIVAVIGVAAGAIWPIINLVSDTQSRIDQTAHTDASLSESVATLQRTVASDSRRIARLEAR